MAEKIVVSPQIYVGHQTRSQDVEPGNTLGFATYYEDNAACRKRQGTIHGWADKERSGDILDNTPLTGFKLSKKVTHGGGWNDLNTLWRIVDPRNFELEITSGNLGKLFQYCDIHRGVIQGECVWGFDKGNQSKPVLLPINSEIYVESQVSTERHYAKSLNIKDLKLGDWVDLQNGTKGTFMGKINYAYKNTDVKHYHDKKFENVYCQVKFASAYIILEDHGSLYFVMTPKVIDAKDGKVEYTKEQVFDILSEKLKKKCAIHEAGSSGNPGKIVYFTYDKPEDVVQQYKFKTITTEDLRVSLSKKRKYDDKHTKFTAYHGLYYIERNEPTLLRMKDGRYAVIHSFLTANQTHVDYYGREADWLKWNKDRSFPQMPYPEWLDGKGPIPMAYVSFLTEDPKPEVGLAMTKNRQFSPRSYRSDAYHGQQVSFDDVAEIMYVRLEHNGKEYTFKD